MNKHVLKDILENVKDSEEVVVKLDNETFIKISKYSLEEDVAVLESDKYLYFIPYALIDYVCAKTEVQDERIDNEGL